MYVLQKLVESGAKEESEGWCFMPEFYSGLEELWDTPVHGSFPMLYETIVTPIWNYRVTINFLYMLFKTILIMQL